MNSNTWLFMAMYFLFISSLVPTNAQAVVVEFLISADDYTALYIDDQLKASYDAPPWGTARASIDLTEGWHKIRLDYANRWGSTGFYFYYKYPGDSDFRLVPREALRSTNVAGETVSGFRANYSNGTVIYGEAPIAHGWWNLYQGQTSARWGGNDPNWGRFSETLTGEILIGEECQNLSVTPFKQTDAAWAGDRLDNRCHEKDKKRPRFDCDEPSKSGIDKVDATIGEIGCYLTSEAIILSYHNVAVTPKALNADFSAKTAGWKAGCDSCYVGYNAGEVRHGSATYYAKKHGQTITESEGDRDTLAKDICERGPALIQIPSEGHFVVATGATDKTGSRFFISDPGKTRTTIDLNMIGSVRLFDGPKSPNKTRKNPAALAIRAYSPVELLVTDPSGRRVGIDPIMSRSYNEIPNASYRVVGVADLEEGPDPDAPKEILISDPESGGYSVQVIGTANGKYGLSVWSIDSSGGREEFNLRGVAIMEGEAQEHPLTYTQSPSLVCDLDQDDDVDQDDIRIITQSRGQVAKIGNMADADKDRKITALDSRACVLRCTSPRCAVR